MQANIPPASISFAVLHKKSLIQHDRGRVVRSQSPPVRLSRVVRNRILSFGFRGLGRYLKFCLQPFIVLDRLAYENQKEDEMRENKSGLSFTGPVAVKSSAIKASTTLSPDLFLEIVNVINNATTFESLFNSTLELAPVDMASYHHFPAVGALDHKTLGTFHGYKLPKVIADFYKNYDMQKPDPVIVSIFAKGNFVWLSDLLGESSPFQPDQISIAESTLKVTGDALCIPLFGPKNRRGFMFMSGGVVRKENGKFLPHQAQALAQIFHCRFCLMIQNIERQINLTKREAQVLELLTYGKTNQDIADILEISVSTVSGYVKKIFLKLDVSDRVSASMRAQSMKAVF